MDKLYPNNDIIIEYFNKPSNPSHKHYLALRMFFHDKASVSVIAEKTGYTKATIYSLVRDFKKNINNDTTEDLFFRELKAGRKEIDVDGGISETIVNLRKKYLSVPQIKSVLDSQKINVSEKYISSTLEKQGFARLPRRDKNSKEEVVSNICEILKAQKVAKLSFEPEIFTSQNAGILSLLPYIKKYNIDEVIEKSMYPGTRILDKLTSILSFLALKLSNIRRYSIDDTWCMDRGLGLFLGTNVLPKAAWFSSYSSAVTREMNVSFLKDLYTVWKENDFVSDTVNMDFSSIPYWGDDDDHLENNWSGKRGKALSSMLAVFAQDPDSGIICYGDATLRHDKQNDTVLEFLDFYSSDKGFNQNLKYLVFDSKTTIYENLKKINQRGIKFITIRRRGEKIVERIKNILPNEWKQIRIIKENGKTRIVKAYEEKAKIAKYGGEIRQVFITDNGKIKPAIMITNDFDIPLNELVKKYGKRWIVEKGISEQIKFFHFNNVSSSMVIKVDFDFTMSILAHNIYRLFAKNLEGFSHCTAQTLFEKFTLNAGEIEINEDFIRVKLKKKKSLPLLLSEMEQFKDVRYSWLDNKKLIITNSTTT